jgi:hypothetical protein
MQELLTHDDVVWALTKLKVEMSTLTTAKKEMRGLIKQQEYLQERLKLSPKKQYPPDVGYDRAEQMQEALRFTKKL